MNKKTFLIALLVLLVAVAGATVYYQKYYEYKTIQIGMYSVTYYTRFSLVPDSSDLEELQEHPAVWEVAWKEPTEKSGQYRWFDWVRGRGYIHAGTAYTEI